MGRTGKGKGGGCAGGSKTDSQPEIPLYSREDIREQYCINKKELDGLERSSHLRRAKGFFGCLTSRKVRFFFLITILPVNTLSRQKQVESLKRTHSRNILGRTMLACNFAPRARTLLDN